MKKGILFFILLLLIAIIFIPFFLPKQLKVNVEKTIQKPVSLVFEEFDNLNNFSEWFEMFRTDSTLKKEFYPPYKGKDARFKWEGNHSKSGSGELTILDSEVNQKVTYLMSEDLGSAFIHINFTELAPEETKISWSYESDTLSYFYRYLTFFIKNQVSDNTLKSFNNLVEKIKDVNPNIGIQEELKPGYVQQTSFVGQKMIGIRNKTSNDKQEINTAIQESLGTMRSFLIDEKKLNPESIGFPTIYWRMRDEIHNEMEFLGGFPITESVQIPEDSGFEIFVIPSSKALLSLHQGSRDSLSTVYDELRKFSKLNGLTPGVNSWEVYIEEESEISTPQTKVYLEVE